MSEKDSNRFAKKLRPNGECIEWTGTCLPKGYGTFCLAGGRFLAHRVAFVHSGGVLTAEQPDVLHTCDNPRCCNPAHLRRGNDMENAGEMSRKGRGRRSAKGYPFGVKRASPGRWQAIARPPGGGRVYYGSFRSWQEASAVASYHKNLGRFGP